ncbi:efflux transporter outer membrane subunit [uncultured Nevskia sp.]|uniref:efflux transporter outer membrane subunit n=1 Tax=uncultured Nevskia sp. TaxID=228950 RepID=UPI0025FEE706|nr:efflux transporter outer membrane subunit [uncultured Nevskia sp.]
MKSRIHFRVIALTLLAGGLAGCAVTAVKPPDPVTAPAAFKETGDWQKAAALSAPIPDDWWTLFQDPVLDDLERRLVIGNENLKATAAAVANARAVYAASRTAFLPSLSAGLDAQRGKDPYTVSATATWELDLWGRLSQAKSGAAASLQASADDLAAAQLSAQAILAETYFSLRTAEAQRSLFERSATAYQHSLDLTQIRYDGGLAGRSDVLQATTQLKGTQAQISELNAQRAQLEHAIAVLLGVPPSALDLSATAALPTAPPVPEQLPASLLERRPDIAAAQRRVIAAYAQIGVADAAWFPTLSLSATAGYIGDALTGLISAPNFAWTVGANLAEVILDGGQRRLASAQARANADQATASYRQTVLTALQEVEDNLVLADQLQQEAALQEQALAAAQRNVEITLDQYRDGTVSALNVVTAQTAALTSENSLLGVRNRQLAAVDQLLKNIAGRWQPVSAKTAIVAAAPDAP